MLHWCHETVMCTQDTGLCWTLRFKYWFVCDFSKYYRRQYDTRLMFNTYPCHLIGFCFLFFLPSDGNSFVGHCSSSSETLEMVFTKCGMMTKHDMQQEVKKQTNKKKGTTSVSTITEMDWNGQDWNNHSDLALVKNVETLGFFFENMDRMMSRSESIKK